MWEMVPTRIDSISTLIVPRRFVNDDRAFTDLPEGIRREGVERADHRSA
jgi:hypothetical protein